MPECPAPDEAMAMLEQLQQGLPVSPVDPACYGPAGGTMIGDGTAAIARAALGPYVDDMRNGMAAAVRTLATYWIHTPGPSLAGNDGSPTDAVAFLSNGLNPLVAIVLCFSLLFGCAMTAWEMRGEPLRKKLAQLLQFVFVQALLAGTVAAALEVVDVTSAWLIEQSTEGTAFADNLMALFDNGGIASALLTIALLGIAAVVAALQVVLMIARGGILICLVGAAGLAVALGEESIRRVLAWIAALVLYKLAAAIVYSVGFRLLGTDTGAAGNGFLQILQGLTLLGAAVLALPATIRAVVPLVAPAAQGRGAGAAATGLAAVAVTKGIR